ncbi:transporter [Flavobacterium alkalisoli]|uniref:Transporter n=1 Tax=Flavobacterium alkalisoli TaxID=2602769 RepID=A0A5B9FQ44_9FLAO|nr:transporter [Flavobacterium alkalisoli]QEE48126.1 transporter [Flavobacterium alkalisoli]
MKKYIIGILLLASQMFYAETEKDTLYPNFRQYMFEFEDFCDACGCSASGGGMGFSSMLDQNFVGIRYMYQSYSSREGIFNNSPWIDESFNTIQAWSRIPVAKNIQVSALVPYHFNSRTPSTGKQSIDGIGDITVLGLYTVYQTKADTLAFRHTLQAGAGVKAPTGTYNSANNGSVNPSFQLGTGSWDYLLATEYVVKHKQFGFNAMVNYVFKTENNENYQFGDQFNYAGTFFYVIEKQKFTFVPQAGLAGEVYASNRQYGEDVPNTKGDILFGRTGFEVGMNKFSFGVNGMLPISQNLTGGKVEANYRLALNLNYSL